MRRARFVYPFVLIALLYLPAFSQTPSQQEPARTLYQRLGGYDAIAAVGDEFLTRLKQDKELSRFFQGVSEDSQRRIRQLAVDQLCAATGGPCLYIGRSMKESHKGLGITKAQWDAAVKHLGGALDKFKVGDKEKADLLAALEPLESDIVERP